MTGPSPFLRPTGGEDEIRYYFLIDRMPAGEAPVEVREQWVGLALPVRYDRKVEAPDPIIGVGVETRVPVRRDDAIVILYSDAIDALSTAGRSGAAAYWEVRWEQRSFALLAFQLGEGRLLPAHVARRLYPELAEEN